MQFTPGMDVVIYPPYADGPLSYGTVDCITPNGDIVLTSGHHFSRQGVELGLWYGSRCTCIAPLTPARTAHIAQAQR